MSLLTQLLGGFLEASYAATGAIDVTNTSQAAEKLGVKLVIIKGISQDLGEAAAVAFLKGADTTLGPIAQKVVDAVNGNVADAVTVVLTLLTTAVSGNA